MNGCLAHAVCCVEPVVAKWPGEASVHSLASVRLVAFEYDPAGQGRGTLVPSGQTWPASQGSASEVASAHLTHAQIIDHYDTSAGVPHTCPRPSESNATQHAHIDIFFMKTPSCTQGADRERVSEADA